MNSSVRSPEITEMQGFCVAADLGSVGRAAKVLRISQPALSKRLQVLETLVGTKLLERSTRGVTLTPAGIKLYPEVRKLLAQLEIIEGLMASSPIDQTPIKLAVSPTVAEFVLPSLLVKFERHHQHQVSTELMISNSVRAREQVRGGRADLGIVAVDPGLADSGDALTEIPYFEGEIVVAMPVDHAWSKLDRIPLDDFLESSLVMRDPGANTRRVVDYFLNQRGLELASPAAELGSTDAVIETAVATGTPALIARLAAERSNGQLLIRGVKGLRFPRHFIIVLAGGESALGSSTRALLHHLLDERPELETV